MYLEDQIDNKEMKQRMLRFTELTQKKSNPYYFFRFKYQDEIFKKKLHTIHAECSICLEMINSNKNGWITRCNHIFHKECLKQWFFKTKWNDSCPMCRQDIGNVSFIDGINYSIYPIDKDTNFLDLLEEQDHLLPNFCHECDEIMGMNRDCKDCLNYQKFGKKNW